MFITPIKPINDIKPINSIGELGKINNNTNDNGNSSGGSLFKSIFDDALNDLKTTEKQSSDDLYKLSIGETDDLHNMMINSKKAEMSFEMFLQLRNKTLDAYNEVMKMGV